MEFDNTQVVKHLATLPPEPPKREERSAWGAPFRAIKAAVADVMGSGADAAKGLSAGRMVEGRAPSYMNPLMAMPGDDMGAAADPGASFDREGLFRSNVGRSFRNVAEDLRPDPATASTAENVVFGVVRPLAKLAVGGVLAGPAGLGLASAEEGFTQSEDLARQGVDVGTRSKVGTLTAVVTAATAGLPMAGSSLKATAALYLAGGPGGFMAQQAATRAILENANYGDLAKQYDPLDPVGLTVSTLIPLPFAAYGARANIRAARKGKPAETAPEAAPSPAPTQDQIDAAMVQNLTIRADVHQAAAKSPDVIRELSMVDQMPASARAADLGLVADEPATAIAPSRPTVPSDMAAQPDAMAAQSQPKPETQPTPSIDAAQALIAETDPAAPARPKASTDPMFSSISARIAELETAAAPIVVRTTEDGRPVTVADELAAVRKEAAEGTDAELGSLDADLVRVAAECALSMGQP